MVFRGIRVSNEDYAWFARRKPAVERERVAFRHWRQAHAHVIKDMAINTGSMSISQGRLRKFR